MTHASGNQHNLHKPISRYAKSICSKTCAQYVKTRKEGIEISLDVGRKHIARQFHMMSSGTPDFTNSLTYLSNMITKCSGIWLVRKQL